MGLGASGRPARNIMAHLCRVAIMPYNNHNYEESKVTGQVQGRVVWHMRGCRVIKTGLIVGWMALFLIGCGSSAAPQNTAAPVTSQTLATVTVESQPTATSVPVLDLESLILDERDLPEGFNLVELERIDNRTAARNRSDPEKWLSNYESWGRIEGFDVEFVNRGENIKLTLAVYRANDGAQESFRRTNAELESEIKRTFEELHIDVIDMEQLQDPGLGDESNALHVRLSTQLLGTRVLVDVINVSFRQSNFLGSATWLSAGARVLLSDVVTLAEKQLGRLN